jgi:hypothetical protein
VKLGYEIRVDGLAGVFHVLGGGIDFDLGHIPALAGMLE